jgi:protocatechuate 3,4-dioxygenase beta subunit
MRTFFAVLATLLLMACVADAQTATATATPFVPAPSARPAAAAPVRDTPAQPAPKGTGVIRGRVTDAKNGEPIRDVFLKVDGAGIPVAVTDTEGRYEIENLPPGRYVLTALKDTFVPWKYGQQKAYGAGRPIDVEDDHAYVANIALMRGAVIAGDVVDPEGEPVSRAYITVLRRRFVDGKPRFVADATDPDTTDDLGQFRLYGIPPGSYIVTVTPGNQLFDISDLSSDRGTFYPGTKSSDQAVVVTVRSGQEVAGLAITALPSRAASINGWVSTDDGSPVSDVMVQAWLPMLLRDGAYPKPAAMRDDGTFVIGNLSPGEYTVLAQTQGGVQQSFALARVVVDDADVDLPLVLRRPATLRGRIVFDDRGPVPNARTVGPQSRRVAVVPGAFGYELRQSINNDWTFEMTPAIGTQLVRPILPAGWTLRRVLLGDVDITDTPVDFDRGNVGPFVVHVTRRQTVLTGMVRDASHRPDDSASIVVFADDPSKWGPESRHLVAFHAGEDGHFEYRGLPEGRYIVAAVTDLEPGEETDPDVLKELRPHGVALTLTEGETRSIDLTTPGEP